MNPGAMEEGAKVAGGFMDAMKSQPVMLGLVIMNLAMVAMLWYTLRISQDLRKSEFEMIFAAQKDVQQLLAKCVIPPRSEGGSFKLQSEESKSVELIPLPRPRPEEAPRE